MHVRVCLFGLILAIDGFMLVQRPEVLRVGNEYVSSCCFSSHDDIVMAITEVVLSILFSTFTFELTDKPIKWNVASVWFPTAGDADALNPELPLNVKLYQPMKQ